MSNIQFKHKELEEEFLNIRSRLKIILDDMAEYSASKNVPFMITDLLSEKNENKKLNRVSVSHDEGRAADIRTFWWSREYINEFMRHFEEKYESWAAISSKTGLPNLIEYHNNKNGVHFHVQIKPYKE